MKPTLREVSFVLAACVGSSWSALAQARTATRLGGAEPGTLERANRAPIVTTSLDKLDAVPWQTIVRFTITVTDPDGDPVDVRMIQRPGGLDFVPALGVSTPYTQEVTWNTGTLGPAPRPTGLGPRDLIFEVKDHFTRPATTRHEVNVSAEVESEARVQVGDVTGDGVDDVVASAQLADFAGAQDVGTVHVWAGGAPLSELPAIRLSVAGAAAGSRLGETLGLLDVNGDGELDIVASEPEATVGLTSRAGAINVWFGGTQLATSTDPDARLVVPSAGAGDEFPQLGWLFDDVSGDGQADLIVRNRRATVAGQQNAGAVYIWNGGSALAGTLAPDAQLQAPAPEPFGAFSWNGPWSEGVVVEDVNADGVLDLIVANPLEGSGAVFNTGKVWFFAGGASLTGQPAPTATLQLASPSSNDELGGDGDPYSIRTADVTGDGHTDIVVTSPNVRLGAQGFGAVHVWPGGPGFSGTRLPAVTLHAGESADEEAFGVTRLADLTGDGVLDIAVSASRATVGGVDDAGAIYVWEGGATLNGAPAPIATLHSTVPGVDGHFGSNDIVLADVSGDSILDIVTVAVGENEGEDEGDAIGAGAAYVFAGGASLTGTPAARARLTAADPWDDHALGYGDLLVSDVTGDGQLDVVTGAQSRVLNRGAIYVFGGGPAMTGEQQQLARLRYNDTTDFGFFFGRMFELVDLSGDGVDDIVAHRQFITGTSSQVDPVFVWQGGRNLSGDPVESIFSPSDSTGYRLNMPGWWFFRDVDADGITDVVSGSSFQEVDGQSAAGSVYVWTGRPVLTDLRPTRAYRRSSPEAGDQLSEAFGRGVVFGDFDADGLMDVLVGAAAATIAGVNDAGALFLWLGTAAGSIPPNVTLRTQSPAAGDGLGG